MNEPAEGPPRPLPGLDLDRLGAYLARERPDLVTGAGPLRARLLSGGRSNLTYAVEHDAARWVLRRPPLGHVLASAHDMGREFRVMAALGPAAVPVPATVLFCDDPAVLGAPFYLMALVDGTVLRDAAALAALGPARAVALSSALADTLAALHLVDAAAVGLGDLGRPDGYLERQVRTWGRQLAASRSRDVPELDELARRLASDVPATGRAAVVHGDYRLDNVVVDVPRRTTPDGAPRLLAVLDWEMATLGDALADLAMALVWYDGLAGLDMPVAATPGDVDGFPPGTVLADRWSAATGVPLDGLDWRLAFSYFKIAAIFEGIHYRHLQGATVGEGFDAIGALVRPTAERGLAALTPARTRQTT